MNKNINSNRLVLRARPLPKREGLRVEIRRKAIEQYQQRVRKQWEAIEAAQVEELKSKTFNNCSHHKDGEDNASEQSQQELDEELERLQQLSLTPPALLCIPKTLDYLSQILKTHQKQVTPTITRILLQISVNYLYWTQEFLIGLLQLLEQIHQVVDVFELLLAMSECAYVDFKTIIYKMFVTSEVFVNNQFNSVKNSFQNSYNVLKVLSNLLIVPPVINQFENLQKLMSLLTNIVQQARNDQRYGRKISLHILEFFYDLCHRLEQKEFTKFIQILQIGQKKWSFLRILAQDCLHYLEKSKSNQCQDIIASDSLIRLKLKMMQIALFIVEFCIQHDKCQHIAQQFLYHFLPLILPVISADLLAFQNQQTDKNYKNPNPKNKRSQIQNKYEHILLQTIYTFIHVRDQLQELPALQFIFLRYPALVQQIYQFYCQSEGVELKLTRIATWICETVIGFLPAPCANNWVANFVCGAILGHKGQRKDQSLLQSVLEISVFCLQEHNTSCGLFPVLCEQKIKTKLDELAQQLDKEKSERSNLQSIEFILQMIQNQERIGI